MRHQVAKRFLLTSFGSFGDMHPYMALAKGLQARGHHVTIATSEFYRSKLEQEGIEFHPIRPPHRPDDRELMGRVMDSRRGTEYVLKHLTFPFIRENYTDLLEAVGTADVLVSGSLAYSAPLVAETTGIPWASSVLAPISFFSALDPPVLPNASYLAALRAWGPAFHRRLFALGKLASRSWVRPFERLRHELGLPPGEHPLFEGQHSPRLVLALFSEHLAARQPDWPPHTRVTGFLWYDKQTAASALSPELKTFLESGSPPLVFTLGSSAVLVQEGFYRESLKAVQALGQRAVLLVGPHPQNLPKELPSGVVAVPYAPYSELLPHAAATVHQGGVGTTGQALRAGRPMLMMPFSHDQFDNAARVTRLGVARTIRRRAYTARQAARELERLLGEAGYSLRAAELGRLVQAEKGLEEACLALEELSG